MNPLAWIKQNIIVHKNLISYAAISLTFSWLCINFAGLVESVHSLSVGRGETNCRVSTLPPMHAFPRGRPTRLRPGRLWQFQNGGRCCPQRIVAHPAGVCHYASVLAGQPKPLQADPGGRWFVVQTGPIAWPPSSPFPVCCAEGKNLFAHGRNVRPLSQRPVGVLRTTPRHVHGTRQQTCQTARPWRRRGWR